MPCVGVCSHYFSQLIQDSSVWEKHGEEPATGLTRGQHGEQMEGLGAGPGRVPGLLSR